MTLSRNKEFNWEGIRFRVSLPSNYDSKQAYPVVLLNDGELDYLSDLSQSVILVGLIPENRLDDFTPWQIRKLGLSRMRLELLTNDLFYLSSIKRERGLDYPYARSVEMSVRFSF